LNRRAGAFSFCGLGLRPDCGSIECGGELPDYGRRRRPGVCVGWKRTTPYPITSWRMTRRRHADFADAVLNWLSTGSDSIPVSWPRVANGTDAITYDVIRMTTQADRTELAISYNGGCPVIGGRADMWRKADASVACAGGLVCSYTDTGSSSTSTYTIEIGDYAAIWFSGQVVSLGEQERTSGCRVNNPVGAVCMERTPGGEPVLRLWNGVAGRLHDLPGEHDGHVGSGVQNQSATVLTDGDRWAWAAAQQGRLNFSSTPFTGCSRTTS